MPWMAAVGAGIGATGKIITTKMGIDAMERAREDAMGLIQQSIDDLNAIGVPPVEAMQLTLEKMRSAGVLTPELEQYISQKDTELKGIQTDPRLADYQMGALDELKQRAEGGFSISDKAGLQAATDEINTQERGARERILQDMAERGALTSGASLAAQLQNQQGAADRRNTAALNTAAQGYQNALQAAAQTGQLAGNIQGQQFGQQAQVASAQDVINRMNAQAMQGVQQRNVANQNLANQYNLNNAQDIMNQNVNIANMQQQYNKQLPQQYFNNQLSIANSKANSRSGQATNVIQGGQESARAYGGAGDAINQLGTSAGTYALQNQEYQKRNAGYEDEES